MSLLTKIMTNIENQSYLTRLDKFLKKTTPLINTLNSKNWDQRVGGYHSDKPCNLGAHLANLYGVNRTCKNSDDFMRGRRVAAEALGCCGWQFDAFLHAGGAPEIPFDTSYPWFNKITMVWENLERITEIPPNSTTDCIPWVQRYHKKFNIQETEVYEKL